MGFSHREMEEFGRFVCQNLITRLQEMKAKKTTELAQAAKKGKFD